MTDQADEKALAITPSKDLTPGTRLRHRGVSVVVLERRKRQGEERSGKPFHEGWWLADNRGGLADFVIDDPESGWEVLDD